MSVPTLIPIPEAALRYGLAEASLRALVKEGKIRAGKLSSGELVVSAEDIDAQKPTPKEELDEYREYAHLKGIGIGINEAAKKYAVPFSTIRGWVGRALIKSIGRQGQKMLLDEADVAYCAKVYKDRDGKQGKWLFKDDGTPYQPKGNLTAE